MTPPRDTLPTAADIVLIGAGHQALVAAAYLLDAGRSVCLLERQARPGGFVRTEELGLPGYRHDTYSAAHPAFAGGPAFAELGPSLARHGLEYVTAPLATGASLPDGRSAVFPVDPAALGEELARLGETENWEALTGATAPYLPALFALTADGLDTAAARSELSSLLRSGRESAVPFSALVTGTAADLLRGAFATEELRALLGPWCLHFAAGPADPASAFWTAFLIAALSGGNPTPVGGSGRLTDALVALVHERGGTIACAADVDEIVVRDGRAVGVRTLDGQQVAAGEAVVASVTPDQLYGRLLRDAPGIPHGIRRQASGYHFKRGCFQLSLALSARPRFLDPRLDAGGLHNLGGGLDAVVASVAQADMGLLPAHPSISWHEPTAVDPSRAPEGGAVARLQILDAPLVPRGDAAGSRYGAGGWSRDTAEAFADRVLAEAERHLPGLTELVVERHYLTPADLAAANPNAGPGDHAAGWNGLGQAFTERPIPAHEGGYRTAVPGAWMIGAATWPGAGVSGSSGRAVARRLIAAGDHRQGVPSQA